MKQASLLRFAPHDAQDKASYHTQGVRDFRRTEIIPIQENYLDSSELNT